MLTQVKVAENLEEVQEVVDTLVKEKYAKTNIYVLAHEKDHTKAVAKATGSSEIGVIDEGPITAVANLFRSRGDELRAKMRSMGVSADEADNLEAEMDDGNIVIIGWGGNMLFNQDNPDPTIFYHPMYSRFPRR